MYVVKFGKPGIQSRTLIEKKDCKIEKKFPECSSHTAGLPVPSSIGHEFFIAPVACRSLAFVDWVQLLRCRCFQKASSLDLIFLSMGECCLYCRGKNWWKEWWVDRLEPGKVEATAAAQMDEEVPSVSGSHGNLADRHHCRIVGRELRVNVTTGLTHFTFLSMQRQNRQRTSQLHKYKQTYLWSFMKDAHWLSILFCTPVAVHCQKNKTRYSY